MPKKGLGVDVLTAARERTAWVFDTFQRVCVSFSGGKDSSVMLHLAMDEAIKRGRRVGVLFIDLEGQYQLTIEHIQECMDLYADHIDPYWVALPLALRNAVSVYEPKWLCWDPDRRDDWIREPPSMAITDEGQWPWFEREMEFEEFVPLFNKEYSQGQLTACLVGIRTDESLNRFRTIASRKKQSFEGRQWTTYTGGTTYNVYPIYDWRTEDIWTYNSREGKCYNRLYDRMHQAGLSLHQQRICQPYGDDQRKGLWLFHIIEPKTWSRIVARVNGANGGALYAKDSGNIQGMRKITLPEGHTWESFAKMLLASMPDKTRDHFEDKIAVFLRWWQVKGNYDEIPDEADPKLEAKKEVPSWRRICKSLLRNDYWCKGLSFGQTKAPAYENYKRIMKKRRAAWGLI
jgi:predicted phosphoadenosine phosphosulfate sulfurtransferase